MQCQARLAAGQEAPAKALRCWLSARLQHKAMSAYHNGLQPFVGIISEAKAAQKQHCSQRLSRMLLKRITDQKAVMADCRLHLQASVLCADRHLTCCKTGRTAGQEKAGNAASNQAEVVSSAGHKMSLDVQSGIAISWREVKLQLMTMDLDSLGECTSRQ